VTDEILYDPRPPTITSAGLRLLRHGSASLSVRAKDTGSGLGRFQLRSGRKVLAKGSRLKRRVVVAIGRHPSARFTLLVLDRAGNMARRTLKLHRK
jgi:hypothetical protein